MKTFLRGKKPGLDDSLALGDELGEKKKIVKPFGRAKSLAVLSRNVLVGKEGPAGGNAVCSVWDFAGDTNGDDLALAGNRHQRVRMAKCGSRGP